MYNEQQELAFEASLPIIEKAEVKTLILEVKKDDKEAVNQQGSKKSMFVSALEVMNNPTVERSFLVEKIIPGSTVNMLTGPSDTGKSIFARQLAVSVALGRSHVIGLELRTEHQKAIVVSTEDGAGDWKEKLQKYDLTEQEKPLLDNLLLVLGDGFNITELESSLKQAPVDLVVIDVFTDLFDKDLNNAINIRSFFLPYKGLAEKYGCTFLFLHHLSKKGELSSPSKMNVLGSQGIESSMRSVLELRPDPNDEDARHLIITKSNYLEPSEKKDSFKLMLNKLTLEFEHTGERAPIGSLGKARVTGTTPETTELIMRLKEDGRSVRSISEQLSKDGITIGKTKVSEIVNEQKSSNKPDKKSD